MTVLENLEGRNRVPVTSVKFKVFKVATGLLLSQARLKNLGLSSKRNKIG